MISDIFGKIGNADVCSAYCDLIASGDRSKRHYYPLFINQSVFPITKMNSGDNASGPGKIFDAIIGGKVKGLVTFGVDLLDSFPISDLKKALKKLDFFCAADTFHNGTNENADILLPLANPLEKNGTYIDLDGKTKKREKVINPPSDGKSELDIIKKLFDMMSGSSDADENVSVTDIDKIEKVELYENAALTNAVNLLKFNKISSKKHPFAFVTKTLPYHWADGSITRRFEWNRENSNKPVVEIHPSAAEKLNIKEGQKVTITSEFGQIKVPVVFSKRILKDMIAADYHWSEIRSLFPLRSTPGVWEINNEPIPVTLGK
jgi:anaerobic selenocysteine-containing dehydrogenase